MEKEYKAHPIEFFHGEALKQFHLYRSKNNLEANFKIDGIIFNEIMIAAKNETKKKYPDEEIPLTDLLAVKQEQSPNSEFLDCIKNLMGVFDTPLYRRNLSGIAKEAINIGRSIIDKYSQLSVPSEVKEGEPKPKNDLSFLRWFIDTEYEWDSTDFRWRQHFSDKGLTDEELHAEFLKTAAPIEKQKD